MFLMAGVILLFVRGFAPSAIGQETWLSSVSTATLQQLAQNSAYIFSGIVIAVERPAVTGPNGAPAVKITFRVENAIRGVRIGQTLVIREWAGLWESGGHYRRGERVLLFLYPASKLGLTSPVGGTLGRFTMDRNGEIFLQPNQITRLGLSPSREAMWRRRGGISSHEFADAIRHRDIRHDNEE
jgi:hypothetical protein